jgi:hypothetical protein
MKKIIAALLITSFFIWACNDSFNDDKDKDGRDTIVKKRDSTIRDTSVVVKDTVKLSK